jgi:hypothetical protein
LDEQKYEGSANSHKRDRRLKDPLENLEYSTADKRLKND